MINAVSIVMSYDMRQYICCVYDTPMTQITGKPQRFMCLGVQHDQEDTANVLLLLTKQYTPTMFIKYDILDYPCIFTGSPEMRYTKFAIIF